VYLRCDIIIVVHNYISLDSLKVINEFKSFGGSTIDPKRSKDTILKALYLINSHALKFHTDDATAIFFSSTKLFQSTDISLKRITYLFIKELSCQAEDVLIVISRLSQDISGKFENVTKSNAIRALCAVTDVLSIFLLGFTHFWS
jgi:coatomer subunit gamma